MQRRTALRLLAGGALGLATSALVDPPWRARPARAGGGCRPYREVSAVVARPAPTGQELPPPFQFTPWRGDAARILATARQQVLGELRAIDAPDCFAAQLPRIEASTTLLAPFEFLVAGSYSQNPSSRDELLQLYRQAPAQALRRIIDIWPSPRAELLIRTPAFFDISAGQILINLGVVDEDFAQSVVPHEFWHALAEVRLSPRPGGGQQRTTGFWTEERPAGSPVWRPIEETIELGVPTFLMNEAVAIEMETTATGRPHQGLRDDLTRSLDALHNLFDASSRERVLQLYLESRDQELKLLAHQASSDARELSRPRGLTDALTGS